MRVKPKNKLLTRPQVIKVVRQRTPLKRFSSTTMYRLLLKKQFPPKVKVGALTFWRSKEVSAWITQLVDGE